MEKTKLTSTTSIEQYQELRAAQNRTKIASLIFERYYERYIEPFKNNAAKHGFSMMAISCLMIESLYAFKKGWKKTGERGGLVFEKFFSESRVFKDFTGSGDDFYANVRCGILHQGETYAGWKITRKGPLFDKATKTINATKFLNAMEDELKIYTDVLKEQTFNSRPWKNALRKLDQICINCKFLPPSCTFQELPHQ